MNKIKLVYDYQVFSLQYYGGISRYIIDLMKYFQDDLLFDAEILSPIYINKYLKNDEEVRRLSGFPISIPSLRIAEIVYLLNGVMFNALHNLWRPDIVHQTYYAKNPCPFKQTKIVLTVHDMIHEKYHHPSKKQQDFIARKRKAILNADRIICISQNTKRDLLDFVDVDPSIVSVIYHGHSLSRLSLKNTFESAPLRNPYILFVGQRGGYKNFISLLKAYSKSKKLKEDFNLICFGGGEFSSSEKDVIDSMELLPEKIIHLSGNDLFLAHVYSNASLFVYPSLYEGFGIPPLEAMSLACPVACTKTSSLPEVVGNAVAFFDPLEVDELLTVLERVLYSTDLTQKLIRDGLKQSQLFSWERCAQETRDVYLSLI